VNSKGNEGLGGVEGLTDTVRVSLWYRELAVEGLCMRNSAFPAQFCCEPQTAVERIKFAATLHWLENSAVFCGLFHMKI
jgi:hypothetical protein